MSPRHPVFGKRTTGRNRNRNVLLPRGALGAITEAAGAGKPKKDDRAVYLAIMGTKHFHPSGWFPLDPDEIAAFYGMSERRVRDALSRMTDARLLVFDGLKCCVFVPDVAEHNILSGEVAQNQHASQAGYAKSGTVAQARAWWARSDSNDSRQGTGDSGQETETALVVGEEDRGAGAPPFDPDDPAWVVYRLERVRPSYPSIELPGLRRTSTHVRRLMDEGIEGKRILAVAQWMCNQIAQEAKDWPRERWTTAYLFSGAWDRINAQCETPWPEYWWDERKGYWWCMCGWSGTKSDALSPFFEEDVEYLETCAYLMRYGWRPPGYEFEDLSDALQRTQWAKQDKLRRDGQPYKERPSMLECDSPEWAIPEVGDGGVYRKADAQYVARHTQGAD